MLIKRLLFIQSIVLFSLTIVALGCSNKDETKEQPIENPIQNNTEIKGYQLLSNLNGHWIGSNETPFGNFEWFAFDFRPISASHLHSIYEGATKQNIITSIFIAEYEGKLQLMARNGGWLGNQYRATYFVLDKAEENQQYKYYRLVDAVGKDKRAYIEFRFENDSLYFDAYKDNSGQDDPIHHMGFKGANINPSYSSVATRFFNFPQKVSEINLENKFVQLIDTNSALFLTEADDPFPKSKHNYISDLKINIRKDSNISNDQLLLYISAEEILNKNGQAYLNKINTTVIRTIDIEANESYYETTYLHPGKYYVTAFSDKDGNAIPSAGDIASSSKEIIVTANSQEEMNINVDLLIQ